MDQRDQKRKKSRSHSRQKKHKDKSKHKHRKRSSSSRDRKKKSKHHEEKVKSEQRSIIQQTVSEIPPQRQPERIKRKYLNISQLPKRPQKSATYNQISREIPLITNIYKVTYQQDAVIVVYAVRFNPFVEPQNQNLRRELIRQQDKNIRDLIGLFVFYNSAIIASKETKQGPLEEKFTSTIDEIPYIINIKKVKVIKMADLENPEANVALEGINFLNFIVKDYFKILNFFEHGKLKRFHDIAKKRDVPGTKFCVIPGFAVNFSQSQQGIIFKIDVANRIVRTETAESFINNLYKEHENKSKEEKRRMVTYEMSRQVVLANYGSYRTYQITDLLFDQNTAEFTVDVANRQGKSEKLTIDQYFKQRYHYEIQNKRAPLLVYHDKRNKKNLFLVPELCIMAGLPTNLSDQTKKQIQEICQNTAQERYQKVRDMQKRLQQATSDTSLSARVMSKEFRLEISSEPIELKSKQLKPPKILFGNQQKVEPKGQNDDKFGLSFNLSEQKAFNRGQKMNVAIIYPPIEFDYEDFKNHLLRQVQGYGVSIDIIQTFVLSEQRNRHLEEITSIIKNKLKPDATILVVVLTKYLKSSYNQIKQLCVSEKNGILSQMLQMESIQKKGMKNMAQKIIVQIMDKCGNIVWAVDNPTKWADNTMIICVIIENLFGAFVASLDQYYTNYYSQISFKISKKVLLDDMADLLKLAFEKYQIINGRFPDRIIYFRESLHDDQVVLLLENEIQIILENANKLNNKFGNNLTVVSITNSYLTKMYRREGDKIFNPPCGTIIDKDVTGKNYEFILLPVYANRGSSSPSLYRVLYDGISIPIEQLQDFVYAQCYNYQNWSGPIKIPAIVKNAQRLAKFVNEVTKTDASPKLRLYLYYL
uniref:Piwi b n=1 Tax=Paramecium bursaria TaxID=74790 RepID=A0A8G1D0N3_9CILI|nr:piwi b [Paramecium bursaria]